METIGNKIGAAALVLVLAAGFAPAAGAGSGGDCGEQQFELSAYAVSIDANGLLGTSNHYPLVQFVASFEWSQPSMVSGYVPAWDDKGALTFTYDEADGLWKTETLVNPTPAEAITVYADARFGGGFISWFESSCADFDPLVAA